MLQIRNQIELKTLTTLGFSAMADSFVVLNSIEEIQNAIDQINLFPEKLVLGGGSNILFIGDYQGLILFPQLFGIQLVSEDEFSVCVSVGASENWHDWVLFSNQKGWYGLENLALIPGTVGAAPVQNIGAYGVEVKKLIRNVECIDLKNGQRHLFNNDECQFEYRDSLFKKAGQGRYLVTRVEFNLSKKADLILTYQPLAEFFADQDNICAKDVLDRVCQIRSQRLPDPKKLANAGSFFKNPVVTKKLFEKLKQNYPDIVAYPNNDEYKLAAGWLIEKAGFKGQRFGDVGVHEFQALVLVNYAETKGVLLYELASKIQQSIQNMFGVTLEAEVRIEGEVRKEDQASENLWNLNNDQ